MGSGLEVVLGLAGGFVFLVNQSSKWCGDLGGVRIVEGFMSCGFVGLVKICGVSGVLGCSGLLRFCVVVHAFR